MGFSTTLSAKPNNYSNVPASHGQAGMLPGMHGNPNGYVGNQINHGTAGQVVKGANWQDPNSLPQGFGGYTAWYNLANGNPIKARYTDATSVARKGQQFEQLPNRYIDDPHNGGGWI